MAGYRQSRCGIFRAANRGSDSGELNPLVAQPFFQTFRQFGGHKNGLSSGVLPRLRQSQTAHDMADANPAVGIGADQKNRTHVSG